MRSERRGRFKAALMAAGLVLIPLASAAQEVIAPLPYPVRSHEEWWRMQYGTSPEDWAAKLGPEYRNKNSGPACVVMLLHYKKRAGIKSDFGSFSDRRFPKIHADSRWKFCRLNEEKGYPGGFEPDDQADVTAAELAGVLLNEDLPAIPHKGPDEVTFERIAGILSQSNLAVCRVDPSAYFSDERPGESRWIVVYAVTADGVILHDPGRNEGRSRSVPRKEFLDALRLADGGSGPVMLECLTMIGNYGDGWHSDGRSRPFIDAFRLHEKWIGRPADPGGNFLVHLVESCVVQDFKQEMDKPRFGKTGASLLFLDRVRLRALWLKGEFFEKYMEIWGFRVLGSPVTEEYETGGITRQDFEKGALELKGGAVVVRGAAGSSPPKKK